MTWPFENDTGRRFFWGFKTAKKKLSLHEFLFVNAAAPFLKSIIKFRLINDFPCFVRNLKGQLVGLLQRRAQNSCN